VDRFVRCWIASSVVRSGLTIGAASASSTDLPPASGGDADAARQDPGGVLAAAQLRVLAGLARTHARGFVHVTTRQNIQFHFVPEATLRDVLAVLAAGGLTTREACGNAVRNITSCPLGGVARDEVFDATPYAQALARALLRQPLAFGLPRKFKMAFEAARPITWSWAFTTSGFARLLGEPAGAPASVRSSGEVRRRSAGRRAYSSPSFRPKKSWAWRSRS